MKFIESFLITKLLSHTVFPGSVSQYILEKLHVAISIILVSNVRKELGQDYVTKKFLSFTWIPQLLYFIWGSLY